MVLAQLALVAAVALPQRDEAPAAADRARRVRRFAGGGLLTLGAGLAAWGASALGGDLRSTPAPRAGAALRTAGPFAVVRHPIYAGLLLGAAGRALASGTTRHRRAAIGLAVLLAVKSRYEERLLTTQHPGYRDYAARVPRLLPSRRRSAPAR